MSDSSEIFNARITDRVDLNERVLIVRIAPDGGQVPAFEPGQFVVVGLPAEVDPNSPLAARRRNRPRLTRRAYSIASAPTSRDHVELLIALVQDGKLTPQLWPLQVGDKLWMSDEAKGQFTLNGAPHDRDLLMISTGTGLAPFVSMVRTYREQNYWRNCIIVHGARIQSDLAFADELRAMAAEDSTIQYHPSLTREPEDSGWQGSRGRVQTMLDPTTYEQRTGLPLDPANTQAWLCGNPGMIEEVTKLLVDLKFVNDVDIQTERYW